MLISVEEKFSPSPSPPAVIVFFFFSHGTTNGQKEALELPFWGSANVGRRSRHQDWEMPVAHAPPTKFHSRESVYYGVNTFQREKILTREVQRPRGKLVPKDNSGENPMADFN